MVLYVVTVYCSLTCTIGSRFLSGSANPLLYEAMWQAAKLVDCPNPEFKTVYDEWLNFTSKDYNGEKKPAINNLGSGSDFTMFLQTQGISSTSMTYVSM